ncbi:AGE family epimerase/isomerase [Roseomonas sp. SSH11]|uniref:AGE family epimerase/isomerase n=1 Tax=Pararoseomonas baculiformis TaxID=2820812 RepID=A0ABS4AC48_9PROT|nr:AGE family epimerase/isomerase [Pararoseomonas baculiformis]MBP0444587.1 AGE family epimerase/isomerase [Pararoseomonas baculiformis]
MPKLDPAWTWLRDQAWPLWLEHGVDWPRRGFHECLELDGSGCPSTFRRLRVVTRQVYVFAAAHEAGLPRADEAVELGLSFLRRHARQADGGYAQRFNLDGAVIDGTRDLYDHAFVLLALASAARVVPPEPLRQEALALMDYLDSGLRHPQGGYREGIPASLPRRQNPHMHLLESCLAAWEAFGEPLFLEHAGELVGLFLARLRDPATGTLPEYFGEGLEPLLTAGRHEVEPGHHCEWAWLLDWHRRAAGPLEGAAEAARALLAFVDRHGINPALGTLRDVLWSDGTVKEPGSRLWPQTERLKSEALRPDARPGGLARAEAALRRHIEGAPPGLWFERLDPEGRPLPGPAPASSLYHLTAGILVARHA